MTTSFTRICLIVFIPAVVNTSGRLYDVFFPFAFFMHTHRGSVCLANLKDWFDFSQSLGNKGYYSPRLIYVVFHTSPSFLSWSSTPPSSYSFPGLISSTIYLSVTCSEAISSFTGFTVHHSSSVKVLSLDLAFFSSLPFFISSLKRGREMKGRGRVFSCRLCFLQESQPLKIVISTG
jgi:hypothetical protein